MTKIQYYRLRLLFLWREIIEHIEFLIFIIKHKKQPKYKYTKHNNIYIAEQERTTSNTPRYNKKTRLWKIATWYGSLHLHTKGKYA